MPGPNVSIGGVSGPRGGISGGHGGSSSGLPGSSPTSGVGTIIRVPFRDAEVVGDQNGMKRGGSVKKMAKGGSTASKRADGCATKGKTKGRFV